MPAALDPTTIVFTELLIGELPNGTVYSRLAECDTTTTTITLRWANDSESLWNTFIGTQGDASEVAWTAVSGHPLTGSLAKTLDDLDHSIVVGHSDRPGITVS